MKFSFDNFKQSLDKRKHENLPDDYFSCDGVIYIYKCLIDDIQSNQIDFSRFTLKELGEAMELLEMGYSEDADAYQYDSTHPFYLANEFSNLEWMIPDLFSNIASKRRRSIRKFI